MPQLYHFGVLTSNVHMAWMRAVCADFYDELTMPPELRKVHQDDDKAVMAAYGFFIKGMTESKCMAELMKMYQNLTEGANA